MHVRRAERDDLLAVGRVAEAAQWSTYGSLLSPPTVEAMIRRDFSPGTLRRRLLSGGLLVAEVDGIVAGAAHGYVAEGAVHLDALVTDPTHRRRGVATALLQAVRDLDPSLPVCADVLLGNDIGERFYEAAGFVPGEILHATLIGEPLVERRWWLSPAWVPAG
ncbi:MAG: GNAT family N-acetyltransferase [Acidimicrobiia bacterium]|nr:GNAT family N-acetyltransferase [Acidimicrobiia bacterium]